MANCSTLVYVLENPDGGKNELIDVNEIFEFEEHLMGKISGILDQSEYLVKPNLVKDVLIRAGIV